ncbi:MAG: hypothetical protein ABIJ21_05655 [Nanoarchaeota archaeon]
MPNKNILLEGDSKDYRDRLISVERHRQTQRRTFGPAILVSAVFFSILIAFVVMLMIIILVFLKQGFSGLHVLLR